MNDSWLDKSFDGVNNDIFDDMIKYLDFPFDDVEGTNGSGSSGESVLKNFHLPIDDEEDNSGGDVGAEDWDYSFQNLEPPPANVLAGLSSAFYGDYFDDNLAKNLNVSCDGSSLLNQQSSTTKASSCRNITLQSKSADVKGSVRFLTSSPVSVLESSSSCSAANSAPINPELSFLVKRRRSKGRRSSTFNMQFTLPFISLASSTSRGSSYMFGSVSESESYLTEKPSKKRLKKKKMKKKKNLTLLSSSSEKKKYLSQEELTIVRKCMHCEVTKTPQWREGPMGPKTLCNACGVRYRSGRLLPEYRPALSPTFVPSLHSNSHKKVVEMRKKSRLPMTMTPSMLSIPPEK